MNGSCGESRERNATMSNQRADVKNPNNRAYYYDRKNRGEQMNPNNRKYWKSRGYGC